MLLAQFQKIGGMNIKESSNGSSFRFTPRSDNRTYSLVEDNRLQSYIHTIYLGDSSLLRCSTLCCAKAKKYI